MDVVVAVAVAVADALADDVIDADALAAVTPVAKELGLTNEQAQKIVDLHLANTTAAQAAQHAQWQATTKQWADVPFWLAPLQTNFEPQSGSAPSLAIRLCST
mgnify:CR=1 FL=1